MYGVYTLPRTWTVNLSSADEALTRLEALYKTDSHKMIQFTAICVMRAAIPRRGERRRTRIVSGALVEAGAEIQACLIWRAWNQ